MTIEPVLTIYQPYASLLFTPKPATPCDCMVPWLDGDGQHAPDCAVFRTPMVKGWETRPNACPSSKLGVRVWIHAAAKKPPTGTIVGDWIPTRWGRMRERPWRDSCREVPMPLGVILGSVVFAESLPIDGNNEIGHMEFVCPQYDGKALTVYRFTDPHRPPTEAVDITDQLPYGDWTDNAGRYAWRATQATKLARPYQFTGGQGWQKSIDPAELGAT